MSPARVPLAGVIGRPVAHSLSPALHGHWLRAAGIEGYYVPLDVGPGDLEAALYTLPRMGFRGVNVTIPHKEAALGFAATVTDRAALIGAANTLTFAEDGRIHADNTDGHGFLENLHERAPAWDPARGPAAVLGAGGAARAVVAALLGAGVREVRLANRTRARAETIRAAFGPRVAVHDWGRLSGALLGAALIVNTTSLGMEGQPPLRLPPGALEPGTTVCDLVYAPLATPLLRAAREAGCAAVDGLGMLLHQGAPGFERWFGARPVVDEAARRAVLEARL